VPAITFCGNSGFILPHTARVGRTFEALALFLAALAILLLLFLPSYIVDMNMSQVAALCPCAVSV